MKSLLAFILCVACAPVFAQDLPPTISGTPAASVEVGKLYYFKPTVKDPEGKTLRFVMSNRPSWITFSYQDGSIKGTPGPSHVATYKNITIYVKDSTHTVASKKFSITVTPAPVPPPTSITQVYACSEAGANGRILESSTVNWPNCATATFQDPFKTLVVAVNTGALPHRWKLASEVTEGRVWAKTGTTTAWVRPEDINWKTATPVPPPVTPPTGGTGVANLDWTPGSKEYTDGKALTVAKYAIYFSTVFGELGDRNVKQPIEVPGTTLKYTFSSLPKGKWYFAVTAIDAAGKEGMIGPVGSKTIL